MAVTAPMTTEQYKKTYGQEPFTTSTTTNTSAKSISQGGTARSIYDSTIGDFLKPIARAGSNLGTLAGYGGIKLADKLSGGKVNEFAQKRTGRTIDESLNYNLNQTRTPSSLIPAFDSGAGQGIGRAIKSSTGDALKTFSYAYGGGAVPGLVSKGLKGQIIGAGLHGAKSGGVGGLTYGIGEGLQDQEFDSDPVGVLTKGIQYGFTGAGLGAGIGAVSPLVAKPLSYLLNRNSENKIEDIILNKYEKGVKPNLPGKTTPTQLDSYRKGVVLAADTIEENKPSLKLTDELGEEVSNQSPKSLQQFSDAIEQTKSSIFKQYDALAKEAGEKGFQMELKPIADELDTVISNKALQLTNPKAVNYAMELKNRLSIAGKLDSETAQEVIKNYNKSLEAFYRNPSYDTASQAAIDAAVVNNMRKSLDEGVSKLTGSQYGDLKKKYGALKAVERDVIKATLRDARKNVKGLIDFSDILSGGQIVNGILTMNPATIAQGVAQKTISEFYKYLNNPNRAIEQMFEKTSKLQRLRTSKASLNNQLQKNPNAVNPATASKNIIPDNIPDKTNKVNTPNKEGGFIKLSGEQDTMPQLTTRVLNDLQDKKMVSKQYIMDATNRGELRQAERDLVRDVLKDFPDGQVDAKEFSNKVRTQLLPLERRSDKELVGRAKFGPTTRYENITLPEEMRGNIADYSEHVYESPIKTSAANVHFNDATFKNYFAHSRVEDLARGPYESVDTIGGNGNTRRVIELQSDLFQKGRLESEGRNVDDARYFVERGKQGLSGGEPQSVLDEAIKRKAELSKLEPYRNTWHERLIREEVKQAAKDGKTKLQFPTGETAMKIEGLGGGEIRWTFDNRGPATPEELKVGKEIWESEPGVGMTNEDAPWIITDVLGDGKFKAIPKDKFDEINVSSRMTSEAQDSLKIKNANSSNWTEQFDISGKVDTNNPIYKFYDKDVRKFLNKFGGKEITDENGVKWIEIPITKEMGEEPVLAFGKVTKSPLAIGALGTAGFAVAGEAHKRANKFIDKDLEEVRNQGTTKVSAQEMPDKPKEEKFVRPTNIKSKVPEKYVNTVKDATKKGIISSNALAALINTENGKWKEDFVNPSGSDTGLGQHNDATYKDINTLFKKNYGREYNRKNGEDNIKATALWMNYLAKKTDGKLKDVVVAYRIGLSGWKALKEGKGTQKFTYAQLKSMADDKWASFEEFYK